MVCHYSSNLHVSYGTMAFLNQTITFFFFFFVEETAKEIRIAWLGLVSIFG